MKGSKATISEIGIGETVVLNCEYLIVREDAGATISNIASVTTDETGETPREDETEETPVVNIYRLTIHYVDAAGTAVAPDYTGEYEVGAAFSIASPAVTGYTPNYATVNSGADGMPAADVEVTVTYTANPVIVPIVPPANSDDSGDTSNTGNTSNSGNSGSGNADHTNGNHTTDTDTCSTD